MFIVIATIEFLLNVRLFLWLYGHQSIEIERRTVELKIQKDPDRMSENLANHAMVEVPQVVDANASDGKTLSQLYAHGLDFFAYPGAALIAIFNLKQVAVICKLL
jgi:hypothetical protein